MRLEEKNAWVWQLLTNKHLKGMADVCIQAPFMNTL